MSFAPKYPENMPKAFVEAIERVHGQRDKKTLRTFSKSHFEDEAFVEAIERVHGQRDKKILRTFTRSRFEDEEAALTKISESAEVATAVAKLENAILVPPQLWEQIVNISITAKEEIRTADKRTNSEKIKKCQEIRESLENSSKLIASEAYGTLSPGMGSEKILEESRPYDQLLLGEVATKPVRILLARGSGGQDFRYSSIESVSSASVSKLCDALSERIEDLIKEIKSADNEFYHMGYSDRRHVERRISSIFEAAYPDIETKTFINARAQTVVALAMVILELREDLEDVAVQFSAFRKARLRKKKRQN